VRGSGPDLKKWVTGSTLWAGKGLGIASWDKVNQTLGNVADASRSANKGVADVIEKVTGMRDGETDLDAAVRRHAPGMLDMGRSLPADAPFIVERQFEPSRLQEANDAIDRWVEKLKGSGKFGPTDEPLLTRLRDRLASRVLISRDSMDPQTVLQNAGKGMESLQGVVGNLSSTVQDPEIQKGLRALGNVGDLAKSVPTLLKGTGLALGAGLLGWGGYNMLRDWLNYRRVKSEREAAQRPTVAPQLKVAAIPWGRAIVRKVLPALGIGGAEGYMNYELDPSHPATAIMGGAIGAAGGASLFKGLGKKWNPQPRAAYGIGGGMFIPRGLTAITESVKSMQGNQSMKPWIYGGAAAGGVGALYLLNKWINKPAAEPAKINSTVFAGGTGGPDNPNVGGKIRVTLPTRKPGDHETTVEVPMENIGLPNTLFTNIRRDTKRRLRTETEARTMHRGPGGALVAPHGLS